MLGKMQDWDLLVTNVIDHRRDALRLLGNSVCPAQAELALRLLTN